MATFVYPDDAPQLLLVLSSILLQPHAAPINHLRCRLLSPQYHPAPGHLSVHAALRPGPEGVVCTLRPDEPSALVGLMGDAAGMPTPTASGGDGGFSPLSGWWDAAGAATASTQLL